MTPRATGARRKTKVTTPSAAADLSLDWLLTGTTLRRFTNEILGKTRLHLRDRPRHHYASLLHPGVLERIISQRPEGLRERLTLVRGDVQYDLTNAPSGAPQQLRDAFAQGFTISLNGMAGFWQPVAQLCTAVAAHLNCPVTATAFLTPANEQGFPRHFDVVDTLILQIDGEKTWQLSKPEITSPQEGQWHRLPDTTAQTPHTSLTLKPGDLLYLPRGVPHAAIATSQPSLHLTLVLLPYTRRDLLVDLIDEAADADVEWRRWIRPVRGNGPKLKLPPRIAQLVALLNPVSVADAIERARERQAGTLVPLAARLTPSSATVAVVAEDVLQRGDDTVISVRQRGDRVVLTCPGDAFEAPLAAATALRFMAHGPTQFPVNDVPGPLSVASNCLLATRLVCMGLLQIEPPQRKLSPRGRRPRSR